MDNPLIDSGRISEADVLLVKETLCAMARDRAASDPQFDLMKQADSLVNVLARVDDQAKTSSTRMDGGTTSAAMQLQYAVSVNEANEVDLTLFEGQSLTLQPAAVPALVELLLSARSQAEK